MGGPELLLSPVEPIDSLDLGEILRGEGRRPVARHGDDERRIRRHPGRHLRSVGVRCHPGHMIAVAVDLVGVQDGAELGHHADGNCRLEPIIDRHEVEGLLGPSGYAGAAYPIGVNEGEGLQQVDGADVVPRHDGLGHDPPLPVVEMHAVGSQADVPPERQVHEAGLHNGVAVPVLPMAVGVQHGASSALDMVGPIEVPCRPVARPRLPVEALDGVALPLHAAPPVDIHRPTAGQRP